jgi:hypothetical protein
MQAYLTDSDSQGIRLSSTRIIQCSSGFKKCGEAVPGLVAELNNAIFQINQSDNGDLSLGRWIKNSAGELVHVGIDKDIPEGCELLDANSMIHLIQKIMKGKTNI